MDVFKVEWSKTGASHIGHTVTYYGFMSDGKVAFSLSSVISFISSEVVV
jgi:anaerobic C4-dicarboxylate transporter